MKEKIRLQLRFTGRVQGVGFRYTAVYGANRLGLTGWVCNKWDSSVLMEVQGTRKLIDKLIGYLNEGTFISIENIDEKEIPLITYETSFEEMPSD